MNRIEYAGSVHDEEEIAAVVEVLRGGATALRIGRNVKELERLVAEAFGKRRGIMVNSGSSALYLAIELLDLSRRGTRSSPPPSPSPPTSRPWCAAGLVPVFVDVTPDTYQIDVDRHRGRHRRAHEGDPRPEPHRQLSGLGPPSAGSPIATASQVVEDSCDCLGATLRGTPTGSPLPTCRSRASRSPTSSRPRERAAWCAWTIPPSSIEPCCCAAGAGAARLQVLRLAARASGNFFSEVDGHGVRRPLHLRRGGLELRTQRAELGRVRTACR